MIANETTPDTGEVERVAKAMCHAESINFSSLNEDDLEEKWLFEKVMWTTRARALQLLTLSSAAEKSSEQGTTSGLGIRRREFLN